MMLINILIHTTSSVDMERESLERTIAAIYSQAPDVDLDAVRLADDEELGRGVLGRAAVRAQRLVRLPHVAQSEV